jgi:DNA-binding XRE family transcriptional regulator
MGMFANLGMTLSLLREIRGKSQSRVAREARIGKSQLSKYENGRELPKLDSLEKILRVLKVDMFEFFYTLYLVDGRAATLGEAGGGVPAVSSSAPASPAPGAGAGGGGDAGPEASGAEGGADLGASGGSAGGVAPAGPASAGTLTGPLYLPPLPHEHPLLEGATDQAFARVFADLLVLYRRVFEQVVLAPRASRPDNIKV